MMNEYQELTDEQWARLKPCNLSFLKWQFSDLK